jgi:hypothetical protein
LDHYLEIRGGTCGKVDSFGGAGAFIEGDFRLIGENNVRAIGAISAVSLTYFGRSASALKISMVTFLLVFRSGTPEPSG